MGFTRLHITGQLPTVRGMKFKTLALTNCGIAVDPSCPQAIMQWQHGTVVMNSDLSLTLTPIGVDGRQLQSDPCKATKKGVYTRYIQSETMKVRNYPRLET